VRPNPGLCRLAPQPGRHATTVDSTRRPAARSPPLPTWRLTMMELAESAGCASDAHTDTLARRRALEASATPFLG